jgi:putative ABC transport system substrate-binding protein
MRAFALVAGRKTANNGAAMTSRRDFLADFLATALAIASAPLAAQEKPAPRVYRIGMLETVPIRANNANLVELHKGMKELGYEEGQHYLILYRSAEGRVERFATLAADLARQKIDVFLARGTPATIAARDTETGIPVIASAVADPVDAKLVASLAAPGGNVTGLTSSVNEIGAKRMELLRALAPGITRVGVPTNPDNPASLAGWKVIEAAAPASSLKAEMLEVRKPEELGDALEASVKNGVDALIIGLETLAQSNQNQIIEFAARQRLPAIYAARNFVDAGGLLSYGVLYPNLYYRAAGYIDKVLKGARPADLPMERPTKFELVINRKTAHALKLAIPPDLFLRSDEVID